VYKKGDAKASLFLFSESGKIYECKTWNAVFSLYFKTILYIINITMGSKTSQGQGELRYETRIYQSGGCNTGN